MGDLWQRRCHHPVGRSLERCLEQRQPSAVSDAERALEAPTRAHPARLAPGGTGARDLPWVAEAADHDHSDGLTKWLSARPTAAVHLQACDEVDRGRSPFWKTPLPLNVNGHCPRPTPLVRMLTGRSGLFRMTKAGLGIVTCLPNTFKTPQMMLSHIC